MKTLKAITIVVLVLAVSGCTTTQRRALGLGTAGAVLGGIIGHQSGHDVAGAAIGGLTGTTVSLAFDTDKKKKTPYEKGYEEGYRQGQLDYANKNWRKKTGQCVGVVLPEETKEGVRSCE